MRISHWLLSVILCCLSINVFAQKKIPFRFATRAEAQMLITDIDNFTNKLNSFDINLRLGKEDGRKSELLRLAMNETLNWSEEEKKKITATFKSLQSKIDKQKLKIKYPQEVILVKTSMKEEMNVAAYTRKNWIALGEKYINEATNEELEYILAHEIFHLLTRSNKEFKKSVYSVIGFNVTERELFFPIDIIEKRISNPDIELYDSYAEFTINGNKQKCSMIIYSKIPFSPEKSLSDYLSVGLIPLNDNLIPVQNDGKTVIYDIEQAEDFYEKIGKNTQYIINPEEILADNFAYLLIQKKDLPNPEILTKIAELLK
ncbi:M48 family metalloprotease [Bacteroides caecigallinarum]|uniref:M48 family metalloprotease n=1 Tax=Bacteroides caecigallinarum TaxID=1411144 RepID=UPI001F418EB0|nr:M48 family metalloprotease [Bacteroides caecigallinarum]